MKNVKQIPCAQNDWRADIAGLIINSHETIVGFPLMNSNSAGAVAARELFNLENAVLAHDTQTDPIFRYANLSALALFEYTWEELMELPSRLSAEQEAQSKRDQTMRTVLRDGYISNYNGVRITKSGRRFVIENATIWNLIEDNGSPAGQAATFKTHHGL